MLLVGDLVSLFSFVLGVTIICFPVCVVKFEVYIKFSVILYTAVL